MIQDLSKSLEAKNYCIYNIQSQMVAKGQFQGDRLNIDLEYLSKGVYFLELFVDSDDRKEVIKVIIE